MADEQTIQLIHAQLDGELDARASAALEQHMLVNPEARALHRDLQRMSQSLGRMVPVPVPAGLRQATLDKSRWRSPVSLRARLIQHRFPALALAASIVFGVVAFILVGSATPGLWPEQLAATIGHQAQPIQAPIVVAKQLSGQGLDGQLTLQPSGNAWLLVFDLHTTESVTVALAYDASVLRFENNGQSSSFPTAPGNSGFVSQGSKRTVLRLESGHAGSIRVRFEASGQLLQELALEVPAGSRGQ